MKTVDYKKHPPVINITKPTMDVLLKQNNCESLIALYVFYCYTACWQHTLQIKATTNYTAKGLGWSVRKVQRIKKELISLDLVRDVVTRNNNSTITGHYIHPRYFASPTKSAGLDGLTDKCLYTNSNKCLNTNIFTKVNEKRKRSHETGLIDTSDTFAIHYGAKIQAKLNLHSKYTPVKPETWAKQINYITNKMRVGRERFRKVMKWYFTKGVKKEYTPKIYKVKDLVDKWPAIEDAMNRGKHKEAPKGPTYREGADGEWGWFEDE